MPDLLQDLRKEHTMNCDLFIIDKFLNRIRCNYPLKFQLIHRQVANYIKSDQQCKQDTSLRCLDLFSEP